MNYSFNEYCQMINETKEILSEEVTEDGLKRVKKSWEKIANEELEVENISGTIYGFGSELAVLRIFHDYNKATGEQKVVGSVGNSKSRGWNFSLETKF